MRMRVPRAWDLIWHCLDCLALVGCHEGTDIPLGRMADAQTREARFNAHKVFDRMWRGRAPMTRAEAYTWMATTLGLDPADAHIGMLTADQCEELSKAVLAWKHNYVHNRHWKQKTRKKRRS